MTTKVKAGEPMIIAILVVTAVTAVGLAEVARRAYFGRHMVNDMQRHELPSTIRILGTAGELEGALRRVSEAERLRARQADQRADHYVAVADSVTGSGGALRPVPTVA
jgi:hypothetical protein